MSTQFLLDEDDIKELTKLMLVMIETQESRKQLCRELGINPQEVSFIIGTSDDTFCTELIDCLNRYGYQEYLCKLCCDKLFPILNKSVYSHRISILKKIVEKLNCNCNQEKQNHPIPTVPNPDASKPESWFTKIGKVNKKLLAGGAIILVGLVVVYSLNKAFSNSDTIPALITTQVPSGTDSPAYFYLFESYNSPGFYIRHQNSLGKITQIPSKLDKKDATFRIVRGLIGKCNSFESINYPGYYLRHQNSLIKLDKEEDDNLFKQDSTFCLEKGLANSTDYSFQSYNYPSKYILNKNGNLYIEEGKGDLFNKDATFKFHSASNIF
jgi:hypothetical protein